MISYVSTSRDRGVLRGIFGAAASGRYAIYHARGGHNPGALLLMLDCEQYYRGDSLLMALCCSSAALGICAENFPFPRR